MEVEIDQFYTDIQVRKVVIRYIALVTSVIILAAVIVWFILTAADNLEFEVKNCQ